MIPIVKRFFRILLRAVKFSMLALLVLAFLGLGHDVLRLNPAQLVALSHRYSLVEWEISNLPDKWTHRLASALPWNSGSGDARSQVLECIRLGEEIERLNAEVAMAAPQTGQDTASIARLQAEVARLETKRNEVRSDAEEALEGTISAVLAEEGLSGWWGLIFPPVDMRLGEPPKVLMTSPRDRIERAYEALLNSDVDIPQSEAMERAVEDQWDLSALVLGIGGVATYPSLVVDSLPLKETLQLASHEWMHHYLVFHPLGRRIFSSPEMNSINETVADIAGREIGSRAYHMLTGSPEPSTTAPPSAGEETVPEPTDQTQDKQFSFAREMRETRRRVDEMLASGAVEEAEAYMEERRELFVANGFRIRKLNQAYFAFHGTYAESPSASPTETAPIADQLHEMRALAPDLKTFLDTISEVSSYQQFLDTYERVKTERGH